MFTFSDKTNEKVKQVLTSCYNRKNRIRIVYGDVKTGKSYLDEYEILGYVGKSTGIKPIPLLINNSRSFGGGSILTDIILKIVDTQTKQVLFQHENYVMPVLTKEISSHKDYLYDVIYNGESVVARFKTEKQANNYIDFMQCKRMSK